MSKSHDPEGPCAHLPQSPVRPTDLVTTEADFCLGKKATKCLMGTEKDQASISDAAIDKDLGIRE
jgi:hypothetical protein